MTLVCTLVGTGHDFARNMLQTMRLLPGVSGVFTHMHCSIAVNECLLFEVTAPSLLKTVHEIPC